MEYPDVELHLLALTCMQMILESNTSHRQPYLLGPIKFQGWLCGRVNHDTQYRWDDYRGPGPWAGAAKFFTFLRSLLRILPLILG